MKRVLRCVFLLLLFSSLPSFAQNSVSRETAIANFQSQSEQSEKGLGIATYALIAMPVLGIVGIMVSDLIHHYGSEGAVYAFLGSNAVLYGLVPMTIVGALALGSLGFAWLSTKNLNNDFQKTSPFVDFECHITSLILYAPVNISCNRSASFAIAANGTLMRETEWDFGDGFQKGNESVDYALGSPGIYLIKVRIQDTKGNIATGSFSLSVLDGSPVFETGLYFSNPYQSAPTNVTFWSDPVQILYPCAVFGFINWTLPNENTTVNAGNETHVFTRNFSDPGIYTYTVATRDSSGRSTVKNLSFEIQTPNPIAKVKMKIEGLGSSYCTYALDPSESRENFPNTTIVSYSWSSSDGAIGNGVTYPPDGSVHGSIACYGESTTYLSVADSNNLTTSVSIRVIGEYRGRRKYCYCYSEGGK